MSIEFENKYLVVKREDIDKYLDPEEQRQLYQCLDGIAEGRSWDGKNNNTYLVINTDESYAGEVAQIMQIHGHYTPGGDISVRVKTERISTCFSCSESEVTEDVLYCPLKQKIVRDDDVCEDFNNETIF